MSSTTQPTSANCPACGAKLDPSLPVGSCAACLLGGLLAEESLVAKHGQEFPEIQGYEILEEIGRGGMGLVYLAQQAHPNRRVALKIVAPHSLRAVQERARFRVEISAMAAVNHPALLPLYETGEDDFGRPWFTMRLASGGSLAQRTAAYTGQWRECAMLISTLCGAVHYAHERGILHRDLKPGNVLFDDKNNAYVADFGLAKWSEQETEFTQSTDMLGSPVYLAPEAALGGARATTTVSDVYGLGTILYELLTGKKPYEATSAAQVLAKIIEGPPPAPRTHQPSLPKDLEVITLKAMAREPARRYASAAALADDLARWLAGKPILARPVGHTERLWIWAKRNPALATLSCLLSTTLIAGGASLWHTNQRLAASLSDLEDRMEFMTRELPVSIMPLGRLDLLDSVFENVAQHYEQQLVITPETQARHADFLTQWAQILRPRGQTEAAIQRLREAMAQAQKAVEAPNPPHAAIYTRVSTGRRLGEALIEGRQFAEAEATLQSAGTFASRNLAETLKMQILSATVTHELGALELAKDNPTGALALTQKTLAQWKPIIPLLQKQPLTASNQQTLVEVLFCYHNLASIAVEQKMKSSEAANYPADYKAKAEELLQLASSNANFRVYALRSNLLLARVENQPKSVILESLRAAEDHASILIATDGSNTEWKTDAVACAYSLAAHMLPLKIEDEVRKWRSVMASRLEALYSTTSTDVRFVTANAAFALYCAKLHIPKDWPELHDWPTARHHFQQTVNARVRLSQLKAANPHYEAVLHRIKEEIKLREGSDAAEKWISQQPRNL